MIEQRRFHTYILECTDGSYYTGYSNDPIARFNKHISGKGAKYTRSHKPVKLALISPMMTKSDAMYMEFKIKRLSHKQKHDLIEWYINTLDNRKSLKHMLDTDFMAKISTYDHLKP